MVIAREDLPPDPWRDRGRHPCRLRRVERADELGVTRCALDHLGTDLDLLAGTVLPAALAGLAHRDRDLMCRPLRGAAAFERAPAQRLDEPIVIEPAAVVIGHRAL